MKTAILDIIIDAITGPRLDWNRTWTGTGAKNYITKKSYRGYNSYLNFIWENFLTFKQVTALGGTIRKGAKGFPVVYALMVDSKDITSDEKDFVGHRYYTVFEQSDIIGIQFETEKESAISPLTVLTSYMDREKIPLELWEPAYSPSRDVLKMPPTSHFSLESEYNSVLAHECVHSTGHEKRTNRHNKKESYTDHRFWSPTYAKEELVAELWAVLITGNTVSQNSIAYIQSWIKALRSEDKKQDIIDAFQLAQKACDYIRDTKFA